MFTNDQMDRVPDEIAKLFREMENDITFDIVNRLSELNKITRTIDYQLYVATQMRTYDHDLRQVIQQYTNKSQKQMEDMFNEVLSEGYAQDADLYKAQGIPFVPFEENDSMQQMVRALVTQAYDDLSNITRTLGIAFRDGTKENLTQYFRDTLNRATVEMMAGAFSYDSTMKRVITDLSNSGIRTISYESGHVDRVDVAASRAVRTGFNQAVSKISDANAGKLQTEYFEVSAHLTARPSHALWQGKVYSRKQLVEICGLGTGPGLLGWNCRHSYYPFIPGVSKRTYTDEQLADIYQKSLETKEWRGQKYTGYEATQYQRMLERRMRVQDEKIRLMKQAGVDSNEIAAMKTKRSATYQEYKQFSEKMGLPEQMNRVFNSEVKTNAHVTVKLPSTFEDVTNEYLDYAKTHTGTVSKDDEYIDTIQHIIDEQSAYWISKTLGRNVQLLKESDVPGVLRADSIVDGDKVFEFKIANSIHSIDKAIGKAVPQIHQTAQGLGGLKPGGIVIYVVNQSITKDEVISAVVKKMVHYKKNDLDIVIRRMNGLEVVIRSKGRK